MATKANPGLPNAKSVVIEIPFGVKGLEAADASAAPKYRILRTNEVDAYEPKPTKTAVAEALFVEAKPAGDKFAGTSRKAAKLSVADAKTEKFADVAALIATVTAHNVMKAKKISTDAKSNRVAEEKRNVRLEAFIYAASVEKDNDYHLIVGRDPDAGAPVYMTMELSGLPASNVKSFAALKAARDAFKKFFDKVFDGNLPGKSYDFYDPPIRIQVEGSLFWDVNHATGGRPGPQSLRPNIPTIWEVHPISKLKLFPPA
jgi:hypothetical protein